MSEILEKLPMEKIETMLETSATILQNTAAGLDSLSDHSLLFPTKSFMRQVLQDHINDLKGALAQLENADAELQRMQ